MTVTTSSFPYNGFIFKIIHLFLTSGLISVSILSPQISTQTLHGNIAFKNSTWGACREVVWSVSVWELTFTSVSICSWKKKTKSITSVTPLPTGYLYRTPRTPECFTLCILNWHPSFYDTGIATLENVSLIRDLTSTQAISLISCHLFNQLTPFIQNPIAKHYMSFNSIKTKSVLSRKIRWKATEIVQKFNSFSTAFATLPENFSCYFYGLNQLSEWIGKCQRLTLLRYKSGATGLKQDNGRFSF